MKPLGKSLAILLCAFLAWRVPSWCERATDGFSLSHISKKIPISLVHNMPPLQPKEHEELIRILNQEFRYLNAGGQCYVFASSDDQYVLKFFKLHRRDPNPWWRNLPVPHAIKKGWNKKLAKRKHKLLRDFNSYSLAYTHLRDESGLVYIHTLSSDEMMPFVSIRDKIGIQYTLDLNQYYFIVQKKGQMVYAHLDKLIEQQLQNEAADAVRSIVDVIVARSQKGIFDDDAKIQRNFAFADGKAIIIDVGRLQKDPSRTHFEVYRKDVVNITERFRNWLHHNHPQLIPILDEKIASIQNTEDLR